MAFIPCGRHTLFIVALRLLEAVAAGADSTTMSDAWNPRRMWQFAVLALLGSILLSVGGKRTHAPSITLREVLALIASFLATLYVLGCTPSTARLDATVLNIVKWGSRVAFAFVIFYASRNLIAVVAGVGAAYLLANLSLVPELAVIAIFAPTSVFLCVKAFTAKPSMSLAGIVGTILILGSTVERSVFGLKLAKIAFGS